MIALKSSVIMHGELQDGHDACVDLTSMKTSARNMVVGLVRLSQIGFLLRTKDTFVPDLIDLY